MNLTRLSKEAKEKIVCIVVLIMVGLLSITVVSKIATSPESYKLTIQSIDEKKVAVMGVSASAAVASTTLAAIPGDATTPIANQIMELSSYLFIVVCILVLEKSLLTVLGYLSFNLLIPISCVMFGIHTFNQKRILKILAFKLMAFALTIVLIIPLSMKIGDKIYEINKTTIEQVTTNTDENVVDSNESKSWVENLLNKAKKTTSDVGEKAKQILNSFIDAIAIFIIAYCAIPIIIVLFVIWFINFIFGLNIPMPNLNAKRAIEKNKKKEQEESEKERMTPNELFSKSID